MNKRSIVRIVASCALLALCAVLLRAPVQAQSYSFAVPEMLMHVIVQPDSSAQIIYDITFENYGSAIDIVDIGTPHGDYDLDTMSASIDGVTLTDIRQSEYVDPGVEVHLADHAIPSGGKGTLHFEMTMPDMIFTDTTNKENASLQITPTWFDSSLVRGTGTIEIRITLLEGIQLDEVLYQDVPFTDKGTENGRVVTVWRFENVAATQAYRVGVSFPQRGLTNIVKVSTWDLFIQWLKQAAGTVGEMIGGCLPVAFFIFILWGIFASVKKAGKPDYLPPIAQVEGGGIKRGLTAPEAAVILEMPLNKVLALVIFGMLEKGLVRQTDDTPLKVEIAEPYRTADKPDLKDAEARAAYRRTVAQQQGTVIHKYEDAFLDLIEAHPDKWVKQLKVVAPMEELVKATAAKMQGFDLSDTQDYYRRVIERAMQQAAALGDIEQREQYLDKYAPWLMLDKDYRTVMTVGGYNYWPRWVRQTRPAAATPLSVPSGGGAVRGGSGRAAPKFGDVASSFAGWAETTMGGMAAAIMPTALQKPTSASTSTSRSSGSFHSSCACACAGCACACACAGGGR